MKSYSNFTDEDIKKLSRNRIITTANDFDLQRNERSYKSWVYPVNGGIYDKEYFGSLREGTCSCGKVKIYGKRCQTCRTEVLTNAQKYNRWARIELNWYYCSGKKSSILKNLLESLDIVYDDSINDILKMRASNNALYKYVTICEIAQFDVKDNKIYATFNHTSIAKCGYEGLIRALRNTNKSNIAKKLTIFLNKYVPVTPAIYRPFSYNPYDYKTKIAISPVSATYQAIIALSQRVTEKVNDDSIELSDKVLLIGSLRRYIGNAMEELSKVVESSKQSIQRQSYSSNISNSGRAVIVGDPKLKIDEVGLPFSLVYELLRYDFIKVLIDKFNISPENAEVAYNLMNPDTLKTFKQYAETRYVLINRPPTLHRFNILMHRIVLTEEKDPSMHFPLMATPPYNADFDGDALMFYLVPKYLEEKFKDSLSPKYLKRYESTDKFIFKPSHEVLYGITLCTRIDPLYEVKNSKNYLTANGIITDYENKVIEYPLDVVKLQGKNTSYAYEKFCKIIGTDITTLTNGQPITAKNLDILLAYVSDLPNNTEVLQQITEFATEVITIEGSTIPDLRSLLHEDPELSKMIKNAKDNLEISKIYEKYLADRINNLKPELKNRIEESNRIKFQQINQIFTPALFMNKKGDFYLATRSIGRGMDEDDYIQHAIENRAMMHMKHVITPNGGWLSRQLRLAAQGYSMNRSKTDVNNIGIELPRNLCEGRTTLDGKLLGKSDSKELIKIRSIAVTRLSYFTPDMISEINTKFKDGSNISLKLGSATTGDVTQSGLALKHGGSLFVLPKSNILYAKEDGHISREGFDYYINDNRYHLPSNFIIKNKDFKKGDIIGYINSYVTPEANSNDLIDFLGGKSTTDLAENNTRIKNLTVCYSPYKGKIRYTNDSVMIGPNKLKLCDALYYFLPNDEVNIGDRICSGVMDCEYYNNLNIDHFIYYRLFREQLNIFLPQLNENCKELLFNCCHKVSLKGLITYTGIINKVAEDKSWMTNLSNQGAGLLLSQTYVTMFESDTNTYIDKKQDLLGDFLTSLILYNEKDNKPE